jgi:hypothetical protein
MRSQRSSGDGQQRLPFDLLPAEPGTATPARRRSGRSARSRPAGEEAFHYRLRGDELASRGWPAGTELLIDRSRRPRRGQVALVSEGGRLKIGVFDVQLGRAALRSDRGSVWIGASARVVGVVTTAGPPLAGMPDLPR